MELQRLDIRSPRSTELDHMMDNAKRASDFLKALAHESRLMMLCILAEGEKSVSELEQQLGSAPADGVAAACASARRRAGQYATRRQDHLLQRRQRRSAHRHRRHLRRVLPQNAQALTVKPRRASLVAQPERLTHDPEKACPSPDPGWEPVSRLREARLRRNLPARLNPTGPRYAGRPHDPRRNPAEPPVQPALTLSSEGNLRYFRDLLT